MSLVKTNYYLRVNPEFGKIVQLISQCFHDIQNFTILFMIYLSTITIVNYTLELNLYQYDPEEGVTTDYPDIRIIFAYFFNTWRNSVGDI